MSSLCVCVPTLNRSELVDRLLENLTHQTRLPDEIIIVDSSPDHKTADVVEHWKASFAPGMLRYIPSERGLLLQRGVGVKHAESDLILMLDDDVMLEPDCLAQMELFMDSEEGQQYGGVGPYITNQYGRNLQRYQKIYYRLGIYESLEPGRWLYCGDFLPLELLKPFDGIHRTDYLAGCSMLYRRFVLQEIQPDPTFGFESEDKHLSLRVAQRYGLGVLGSARLRHDEIGGGRPTHFRYAKNSTRNRAIILVECDPRPSLKRYFAFLVTQLLNNVRVTLTSLLARRWDSSKMAGMWMGWGWNVLVRPRPKKWM